MPSLALNLAHVDLRVISVEDAPDLLRLYSDSRTTEFLPLRIDTITDAERVVFGYLACWQERGFGLWSIRERDTGRMIGRCGFLYWNDSEPEVPQYELAYLIEPEAWGRGTATECAQACLRFGFETRGFDRVFAKTNERNIGSWRVMEKLGMTKAPMERFNSQHKVFYTMSSEQWHALSSRHTDDAER